MDRITKTERDALVDLVREKLREREELSKSLGVPPVVKFWQELLEKLQKT
jgi:tRNA A37 threonylcarbamoyladenosine dehydratase